jgi:preprotein translocase subunit SecA
MAQRDPLVEYQREGFDMFAAMLEGLKEESVGFLFNLQVEVAEPQPEGVSVDPGLRSPMGALLPTEEPVNGNGAPAALRARGLNEPAPSGLNYSGPAEDGGTEVHRSSGPATDGGTRRERREAARQQSKSAKPRRKK